MFRILLLCAAVFAAPVVSAAEPQPISVWTLKAGHYTVVGGKIVNFPPSGPVIPPPDDPVVPPPVVPSSDLAKAVTAAVNKIPASDKRNAAALKLSKIYEMLAGQKLPPAKAVEAVNTIVGLGLGSDSKTLEGVYAVVSAALGKCTTEAAVAAVLTEASEAVGATVPASGDDAKATAELYGIDWDVFMKFLMDLLIKLLPIILAL